MTKPSSNRRRARLPGSLQILAGVVVLAGTTEAATTPGAHCLEIADAGERLACFDAAIGTAVQAGKDASVPITLPAGAAAAETRAEAPTTQVAGSDDAPSARKPSPDSLIDRTWGFLPDSRDAYVALHQPNYLLLARYSSDVNTEPYEPLFDAFDEEADFEDLEAKFQLSFKGRLLASEDRRWGLWFAYTQQSNWQLYSGDISRPFRETNYMPEIFGSFRPGVEVLGMNWNLLNFGYTHQSNGRSDPISRSWDRVFVEAGLERGSFVLLTRAWTRIRPGEYEDDNPDMTDYMGYGEVTGHYRWNDQTVALMARGNLATGKGAAQLTWSTRPLLGPLRGYLQVFSGYGESMIDYDWNQTTVGLGFTLNERF